MSAPTTAAAAAAKWHPATPAERAATEVQYAGCVAAWGRDPQYRKGIAHHLVAEVHPMFRRAFAACVDGYRASGKVDVRRFQQCCRSLQGHHEGEDQIYFPRTARSRPDLAADLDYLSLDHQHLHPLERRAMAGDGEALVEFVSFLDDHLNREEMIIVPILLTPGFVI